MNGALRLDVEDFLYYEAWLLDRRDFESWLKLFTPNIRYWAPVRLELGRGQEDLYEKDLLAHFDDNAGSLGLRVRRLLGSSIHSEIPPSRTRHMISNIRILADAGDTVSATSNFLCYQNRLSEDRLHAGRREDTLRRIDGSWLIEQRCIIFDHSVIPSLTILF